MEVEMEHVKASCLCGTKREAIELTAMPLQGTTSDD